ncbi:hypothetical protein EV694_1604 [Volucribacter psittacicida]|uniref:Dithiol-disulfide isomerase n=1 Tax=Volucribacter psittacicida TaxID=203482 RepID=A0A4R1FRR7_9PAST|nr:DUF5377 family protein [Volucribacter psittacicida]TCJ98006.1 hypothetical protein EV694_1604 [Volucribacter psittacicida]
MSIEKQPLFSNSWTVRIGDPGEEGANSHLFETTYVDLEAYWQGEQLHYCFTRKIEEHIELQQEFIDLKELFKFLQDYMDPISLGLLGVNIGKLLSEKNQ